jgi:hypothetical protein
MNRYRVVRMTGDDLVVGADFVLNESGFVLFKKTSTDLLKGTILIRQIKATQVKEIILEEDEDDD